MKVAIDWPNMWLSGSRFRNRIGANGRAYRWYLAISRSIGTMLARMFRCVSTTPLGSAVAPDVKMISAIDRRGSGAAGWGLGAGTGGDRSHPLQRSQSLRSARRGAWSVNSGTTSPATMALASTMSAIRSTGRPSAR